MAWTGKAYSFICNKTKKQKVLIGKDLKFTEIWYLVILLPFLLMELEPELIQHSTVLII